LHSLQLISPVIILIILLFKMFNIRLSFARELRLIIERRIGGGVNLAVDHFDLFRWGILACFGLLVVDKKVSKTADIRRLIT